MSKPTEQEKWIIKELAGKELVPKKGLFKKVYALEEPGKGLGNDIAATALTTVIALYALTTNAADAEGTKAEDTMSGVVSAEVMGNQDFSDSRLELELKGFEAAAQNWSNEGHKLVTTGFGVRTPRLGNIVELRGTGLVNSGDQPVSGGYNLVSIFHIDPALLGVGGGQLIGDAGHFRVHGFAGADIGIVKLLADVLYDSGIEGLNGSGVDVRGFGSAKLGPVYMSFGKSEGSKLITYLGYLNPGGFGAILSNKADYETGDSSHELILSLDSTTKRKRLDFFSNVKAGVGADGHADFVFDPTIGYAPFLGQFGRYNLQLSYARSREDHTAKALFAYNPKNDMNFVHVGAQHEHGPEKDLTSILLESCLDLNGILIVPSVQIGIQEPVFEGSVHVRKYFGI